MNQNISIDTVFRSCMTCLLSFKEILHIAIIGANDGKLGDPSFAFGRRYTDRTSFVLVEPQKSLITYLEKNYAFHPRHKIYNGAIASSEFITLYSVREEYWDRVQPHYAGSDWPSYRAPTGITSSLREHVESWIRNVSSLNPDALIESNQVPCKTLHSLLQELNEPAEIDVLQIDTEGTDDIVLSCCDLEKTNPRLILMETAHLSDNKEAELIRLMDSKGYASIRDNMNSLFIRYQRKEC